MKLLETLRRERRLYGSCPSCDESFRLSDAELFDATSQLPPRADEYLAELKRALKEDREALAHDKLKLVERSTTAARASNVGKIVEKIVPSLPGFPLEPADCRPLFEPIDFISFTGLAATGQVSALVFIDVKTGRGGLSGSQREIRDVVERGKVSLVVANTRAGAKR